MAEIKKVCKTMNTQKSKIMKINQFPSQDESFRPNLPSPYNRVYGGTGDGRYQPTPMETEAIWTEEVATSSSSPFHHSNGNNNNYAIPTVAAIPVVVNGTPFVNGKTSDAVNNKTPDSATIRKPDTPFPGPPYGQQIYYNSKVTPSPGMYHSGIAMCTLDRRHSSHHASDDDSSSSSSSSLNDRRHESASFKRNTRHSSRRRSHRTHVVSSVHQAARDVKYQAREALGLKRKHPKPIHRVIHCVKRTKSSLKNSLRKMLGRT